MEETTVSPVDLAILFATLERIDARLAHLEEVFSRYEPLLIEANRRMAGPLRWQKGRGAPWPEK